MSSTVVQLLSHAWLFVTPWTVTHQASLSFTTSRSLLKLLFIESVMPSNHLILCHPVLLLPSIFPSIRVSSNELTLPVRWLKYWSFHHQSFQWIFRVGFLYGWLVWSPCCPRSSEDSSATPQFKSINSSTLSFVYGPTLTSIHDSGKTIALTI